jgi:hypothetical protein
MLKGGTEHTISLIIRATGMISRALEYSKSVSFCTTAAKLDFAACPRYAKCAFRVGF